MTLASPMPLIRARIEANWTTTPVRWPNEPFVIPVDGNGRSLPWVALDMIMGHARIRTFGLPGQRLYGNDGTALIEVFVPTQTGDALARSHAATLAELFRDIDLVDGTDRVRCQAPSISRGSQRDETGSWYAVSASVPFIFDFRA
jgi:hypothetical protein